MFDRILQVIAICVPVFTVIALGAWLRRRRLMDDHHHAFLSWVVNYFSLPALIFGAVAAQDFANLVNIPVIVSTLGATAIMLVCGLAITVIVKSTSGLRAPLVFAGYWANVTYLGFPLAESAYGADGRTVASIVNGFTMPVFVASGIVVLQCSLPGVRLSPRRIAGKALSNPIVLAALCGVAASLLIHAAPLEAWWTSDGTSGRTARRLAQVVAKFLSLIGQLGLPGALLCIGFGLRWRALTDHRRLLVWTVIAKLILAPLATWILLSFFPSVPDHDRVVAVTLMATPCAVAAYVISREMDANGPFVAAHLTVTTILSCLTLPLWLYLVLP